MRSRIPIDYLLKHKKGHHMFGSSNISPDYTFTQTENRLFTSNTSLGASTAVEEIGVSKKDSPLKEKDKTKTAESIGQEKSAETTNPLRKDEVKEALKRSKVEPQDLFDDEEDYEGSFIYDGKASSITTSFEALAAALGVSGDKITKEQLVAFLQTLSSKTSLEGDTSKEVAFVKNLIAKFDTISNGADYITSFNGVNEPQDYKTVTPEQVVPPIDIRI